MLKIVNFYTIRLISVKFLNAQWQNDVSNNRRRHVADQENEPEISGGSKELFMNRYYRTIISVLPLIVIIVLTSVDCYSQKYMPGSDNYVDMGNPDDEQFHELRGWGGTSGILPKWLGRDRTGRYQQLRRSNSVKLFVSQLGVPYSLTFRGEPGACDDSFEVYVNNTGPLYIYKNKEASSQKSLHQITIDSSLITDTTVEVSFRNIADDSCGRAAIGFVELEPLADTLAPQQSLFKAPRITLQRALQITGDYAEVEKIELTNYTLIEAKLITCNERDQCWKLRWGRIDRGPEDYLEFTVSMQGVVSYSLSR